VLATTAATDPAQQARSLQDKFSSQHGHLQDAPMQASAQPSQHSMQLPQDQQQRMPSELLQLAQFDEPRIHWLLVVLGIGVINVLGLQAVLKVLQASKDSKCHAGRVLRRALSDLVLLVPCGFGAGLLSLYEHVCGCEVGQQ
jgi:hypothetical protein